MKSEKDSYRLLIEHLPDAFAYHQIILDAQGIPVDYIFLEINKAFEEMTGLKRQEIIGKKVSEVLPGIDKADFNWIGTYGKVALSGEQIRFESFFETFGRWYDVRAYSDKAGYFAVAFRDISKSKETEQALLESEEKHRRLFETMAQGVVYQAADGTIISANPAAEEILGLSLDQMQGKTSLDPGWQSIREDGSVFPGEDHAAMVALRTGKKVGPLIMGVYHPKKQEHVWLSINATPLFKPGETKPFQAYATFDNITERKKADEALLREKREKELIINNLAEQVTFLDLDMNIIWTNSKDIVDQNLNPDNYLGEKCYKAYHQLSEPCPHCPIIDVFKSGIGCSGGYRSPDGRYWQMTGIPVVDDSGEMVGVLDTALDISELKAAELENIKLQNDLEQRVIERTAQLEASNRELDAFAYSVSHDLRAPLRAMGGFSEILQSDYGAKLDDQGKHYLDRIQKAAERMGELIDDLLILSRVTRVDLQYGQVNISEMTAEIIAELQAAEPERSVFVEIAAGMTARGDRNLLHLALENLLGNAWKFSSGNSQARIEVGCAIEEKNTFYVADNGAGFDMNYADKLYVPFQRLHGTGEFPGTGIGLSIVYRIITRHGGKIWAESEVGNGASFFFTIP
jgi:PAS domain S-box-containing protein